MGRVLHSRGVLLQLKWCILFHTWRIVTKAGLAVLENGIATGGIAAHPAFGISSGQIEEAKELIFDLLGVSGEDAILFAAVMVIVKRILSKKSSWWSWRRGAADTPPRETMFGLPSILVHPICSFELVVGYIL